MSKGRKVTRYPEVDLSFPEDAQVLPADAFGAVDVRKSVLKQLGQERQSMTVALGLALGSVA